jgi:outer membrane lipoprotein-sorting protein
MKKRLGLKHQLLFLLFLLVQTSCIKKTTVVPQEQRLLPAKTASRSELLEGLHEKSKEIQTLKATVALDFSRGGPQSGVLDEYRQTKGYVFVERPSHIRIQVQMPIVLTTVATMVSDGSEYRVSIPIKNQYAVMNVDAPVNPKNSLSNLRPKIFLDGLFVDLTPYENRPSVKSLFEENVEGVRSYYIFTFVDTAGPELQPLEKIWIDRSNLEVSRKQVFGKEGKVETDVDYLNYKMRDGLAFPEVIVIHRPVEDFTVKMTFQQLAANEKLEAKVFDLPRPEGSELVPLTN